MQSMYILNHVFKNLSFLSTSEMQNNTSSISYHIKESNSRYLSQEQKGRWPTSMGTQITMLMWRSFKQSKGHILNKYEVTQSLFLGAIASLVYYQIADLLSTLRDRMGLVIYTLYVSLSFILSINFHFVFQLSIIMFFSCTVRRY